MTVKDLQTSTCLKYWQKLKGKLFPLYIMGQHWAPKSSLMKWEKGMQDDMSGSWNPPKIKWELQDILQKTRGKLPRELINSWCFHACKQEMCPFQGDIRETYPAYAKASIVGIKYLYKHFHKWFHLDSSSMSWGGKAKWSSGRCYLKAFVVLGVKEKETKHKVINQNLFPHIAWCIFVTLLTVWYICMYNRIYALKYAVKVLFSCAIKDSNNIWFICFSWVASWLFGFFNELYRCIILGFLIKGNYFSGVNSAFMHCPHLGWQWMIFLLLRVFFVSTFWKIGDFFFLSEQN